MTKLHLQEMVTASAKLSDDHLNIRRKLLVLINPFSGPGKAPKIFKNTVQPLIEKSGSFYEVITTGRRNSAYDFVKNCSNLYDWDSIVIISGDGLVFEVFNGLMARDDWKKAVKIPVGIIPGGSGNGLAATIEFYSGMKCYQNPIVSCTLNVVTGHPHPIDLVKINFPSKVIYSLLSIGWGLIADIDIESEGLRFLGHSRFTLWAIYRSLVRKSYRGVLSYLPVQCDNQCLEETVNVLDYGIPCCDINPVQSHDSDDHVCQQQTDSNQNSSPKTDDVLKKDDKYQSNKNKEEKDDKQEHHTIPSLNESVPSSWYRIEDDFIMIHTTSQTHISTSVNFAPRSSLNDGVIWLVYLTSKISTKNLLEFLSSLGAGGRHIDLPFVNVIPVKAFRVEPLTRDGRLSIDGEEMKVEAFQAEILPSMGRILTIEPKGL